MYVAKFKCNVCGETRNEVVVVSRVCSSCRVAEEERNRRVHFASLEGLTLLERIRKLEQDHYDTDANARLNSIEAKHATY